MDGRMDVRTDGHFPPRPMLLGRLPTFGSRPKNAQKPLPIELLLLAQIYASNHLSAGALTQTHWGSLHRSPRPPSWFRGGAHGEREGGRGGGKEGGEGREGNGREGRGGCPGMPKSRVGKPNLTATSDVNTGICFPVVLPNALV